MALEKGYLFVSAEAHAAAPMAGKDRWVRVSEWSRWVGKYRVNDTWNIIGL
jgi:hypothetical protein